MPTHAEKRRVPHTPEQMFDLAADVERYPEFLPWCVATRIRKREGNTINADMVIGFKMVREKFTTEAVFDKPRRIDVAYKNGPFKYLKSHWIFEDSGDGGCNVDFFIDFEFRSPFFRRLLEAVFTEASQRLVSAFEKRAGELYAR
ncbi:MAG: type II toxin-antitoxin system RatA family toxin [Rhodospirillales bacterium]|nr:type II toxin-antitoxin system RatA family toxin [Rhodospirillales bacterium]MCW8862723.1 type II toxin-antitoxin system RatA family toxin [Rhodospirillales bacterium]MCW8951742.1 type II toxin-antitoxin system RatA family toxin [Rhodospirillales bacterium]MCW9002324.1 type II toxin-antitoxin system RatA family toxin [Rhodospirillales bacterium]